MHVRTTRLPRYTAGLAVIAAAAVAGCAAGSGTGATAPPVTALDAVKLAADTSSHANSFTGTISVAVAAKPGAPTSAGPTSSSLTMTMAERLRPSLLLSADVTSFTSAGQPVPGGMGEVLTPSTLYVKAPFLTQQAHLSKPWLSLPLSAASNATGINLGQLLNTATRNSPLTQTQMFAAATSVRKVGTGTVNGVPVTEYTGTLPVSAALSKVSGTFSTQLKQQISSLGLTTETFTVWVDDQHITRKAHVVADGKSIRETVNLTITSINQPVHVTVPPASQTQPLPGLGNGTSV